ncbi:hypothetical protein [Sediminibacterium sp.]|uniref:hypothetical protein n=1 Tax=Sediminibacterium sp. TaxID=1917865 RepID=UPI003F6F152E
MRFFLFLFVSAFLLFLGCKPPQKKPNTPITQGVKGVISKISGNQMPRIGAPPSVPQPFLTTVFFYEPTDINRTHQWTPGPLFTNIYTKLIMTTNTDSTGAYIAKLPEGTYSVFVQVNQQFFANSFDIRNNINLVTVEKGKMTELNMVVNNTASN